MNIENTVITSVFTAITTLVIVFCGFWSMAMWEDNRRLETSLAALERAYEKCRRTNAILECEKAGEHSCEKRVDELQCKAAEMLKPIQKEFVK